MKKQREILLGITPFLLIMAVVAVLYFQQKSELEAFIIEEILLLAAMVFILETNILPYKRLQRFFSNRDAKEKKKYEMVESPVTAPILQDIQLSLLTEQINPHFLYNTLESIRGQALYNDDFVVADMAETLGTFFRYGISRKGNIVTLNDEIKNVQIYLKIQQFRFQNKFTLKIIMDDEQTGEYQIPKLTLQPIVENALVHGLDTSKEGGCIILRVIETDNKLILSIKDNGKGISSAKLEEQNSNFAKPFYKVSKYNSGMKGGIALYNINNRLKLMYGETFGIYLFSTENVGTEVQITLPKIKAEK